jgi:hypothetical protein
VKVVTDEVNVISVGVISQSHAIIHSKLEVTLYYLSQPALPAYSALPSLQLCVVVQNDIHMHINELNLIAISLMH